MGENVAKVPCSICARGPRHSVVSTAAKRGLSVGQVIPRLPRKKKIEFPSTVRKTGAYGTKTYSGHIPQNTLTYGKPNSLNQVFK